MDAEGEREAEERTMKVPVPPGRWRWCAREIGGRVAIWMREGEVLQLSSAGEVPVIVYVGDDEAVVSWIRERVQDMRRMGLDPVLSMHGAGP